MQTDFIYEMTVDKDPSFLFFFYICHLRLSSLLYYWRFYNPREMLKWCLFNYGHFWSSGHLENTYLKHTFPFISESTGNTRHSVIFTTSVMMYCLITNILTFWDKTRVKSKKRKEKRCVYVRVCDRCWQITVSMSKWSKITVIVIISIKKTLNVMYDWLESKKKNDWATNVWSWYS